MSEPDRQQQKVSEFIRLLPLTSAIAGLPDAPGGGYYNEGQMEARAMSLRTAFKVARQLLRDVAAAPRSEGPAAE